VLKAAKPCFSDIVEVSGIVLAREEMVVRPERQGLKVAEVLADAGDSVNAGQTLARLSTIEHGGERRRDAAAPARDCPGFIFEEYGAVAGHSVKEYTSVWPWRVRACIPGRCLVHRSAWHGPSSPRTFFSAAAGLAPPKQALAGD
jgi:hypothetical protein